MTDYIKRSDDCAGALGQYVVGISSSFITLSKTVHDQAVTPEQRDAAGGQYNTLIVVPHVKILGKCPVGGSSEYLNSDEVNRLYAAKRGCRPRNGVGV